MFWGKWKANFFGEPSAPGPASALYAHAHNYAFTLFIDIMFNSDSWMHTVLILNLTLHIKLELVISFCKSNSAIKLILSS